MKINAEGAKVTGTELFGDVNTGDEGKEFCDGAILVDIDYMEHKSAIVIGLSSEEEMDEVRLCGIIKDGRLIKTSFGWDSFLHSIHFNITFSFSCRPS